MLELRLYIDPDAPLSFVEPNVLPAAAPDAQPWLTDVGDLVRQARTGQYRGAFSNEAANVTVALDNTNRQASALIGRPLRVRAEIYDGDTLYFAGLVQAISYSTTLDIEVGA